MNLELRHLRYFLAVAEELHFGRAARRLNMSQPPLSIQIRALEEIVGATLFQRTQRRVLLTPAGEVLMAEAREILARAQKALETTRSAGRGEIGQLTIGFVSVADYNVLPPILRELRARAPGVRLTLKEATTDVQLRALAERSMDAGFVLPPVDHPALEYHRIHREPFLAALPQHHPLAAEAGPLALARLADSPFVLTPRSHAPRLHDDIVSFCKRCGFSPRVDQEAVQMQTVVSLVSAGIGVALIPASLRHLGRTGVVYRSLAETSPLTELGLAWRRGDTRASLNMLLEVTAAFSPGDLTEEM